MIRVFALTLGIGLVTAFSGIVRAEDPPAATEPDKKAEMKPEEIVVTGEAVEGLASYDEFMRRVMAKWNVPGGAIAVAKDGKLVFARGYGLADRDAKKAVEPDSLFRIASISKPITAVAVLRLVEQGKIDLDERALPAIGPLEGPADAKPDPRLEKITVRQLLQHTGGWDRDKSFDAMFIPKQAAEGVGAPSPAEAMTVIRYMQGVPLDFDPGTKYAYSNLGYAILGRLIERRTGKPYGVVVEQEVLRPAGISRMRLGRTLKEFRAKDEVQYYNFDEQDEPRSVFAYGKRRVQWPDGGFYVEAMDAHGGWIASAVDLVKFACAIDARGRKDATPLLSKGSLEAMTARPNPDVAEGNETYYGLGWSLRRDGDDMNWWHTGSLPGTSTILVRAHNGMVWAVVFNTRPKDGGPFNRAVDSGCWEAAAAVKEWPQHDLFERFK